MSISDGITGKKGNVTISIGSEMRFQSDSYDDIAHEISKTIKDSYYIHPTNIASCIIQGIKYPEHSFSNEEIDSAMEYLNKRMHIIQEDMHPFLLSQYSNSVL
jgi:hypothetical protein